LSKGCKAKEECEKERENLIHGVAKFWLR